MIRLELDLLIGRTTADVFDHVTRVEAYPEWQRGAGIVGVVREDSGPLGVGSRFRMDRVTRGNRGRVACTVTVHEPGRRFAFRFEDSAGFTAEVDTQLLAEGAATRLVWRFAMTTPGLLRFAGAMLRNEIRRAALDDLGRLKDALERVAG